jgi:septation ring formation regulator EzrA
MQTWPDYERSAENKMVVIQGNIGEGLKTGALTPDQSQMFLSTLKGLRTDYEALRNKSVYREEWDRLHKRLDVLSEDIRKAQTRSTRVDAPGNSEKIVALQGKIDDGKIHRRWSSADEREFQSRLDAIRRDYLRMTEGGRSTTYEESDDIARRLDLLETDLNRYRQ